MGKHATKIDWTHHPGFKGKTLNPLRGEDGRWHCTKISPGCSNCYAESMNLSGYWNPDKYRIPYKAHADRMELHEETLLKPLGWGKPHCVFMCSMTDIFHPAVTDKWLYRLFAMMLMADKHRFLILTKRPERAVEFIYGEHFWAILEGNVHRLYHERTGKDPSMWYAVHEFPKHLWFGVSCENQEYAEKRIPLLLKLPFAVRFVSLEPLLGPINLRNLNTAPLLSLDALTGNETMEGVPANGPSLDWVIVGGESGKNARPCRLKWIRAIVDDCQETGVSVFVKQLGRRVIEDYSVDQGEAYLALRNKKGADVAEWPADLRVKELPNAAR